MPKFCMTNDLDAALASIPAPARDVLGKGVKDLIANVAQDVGKIGKQNNDKGLVAEGKAMLAAAGKVTDGLATLKNIWTKETFVQVNVEDGGFYYEINLPADGKIGGKAPFLKPETCELMTQYSMFCGTPHVILFMDKSGKVENIQVETDFIAD
jgi:hypothetical protein